MPMHIYNKHNCHHHRQYLHNDRVVIVYRHSMLHCRKCKNVLSYSDSLDPGSGGGSGNVRGMGVQPNNLQMIEAGNGYVWGQITPRPFCPRKVGHFAPPTIYKSGTKFKLLFLTTDLYYKNMQ